MSYFIRIFCRSDKIVNCREIASFISDGYFFKQALKFDPPAASLESGNLVWKSFKILYSDERRPIIIEHNIDDEVQKAEIREILDILDISRDSKSKRLVQCFLNSTKHVYSIEIDRENIPGDCWEMLDSLEAFIAKSCDGLVYSPDDGFFNERLDKIYRL